MTRSPLTFAFGKGGSEVHSTRYTWSLKKGKKWWLTWLAADSVASQMFTYNLQANDWGETGFCTVMMGFTYGTSTSNVWVWQHWKKAAKCRNVAFDLWPESTHCTCSFSKIMWLITCTCTIRLCLRVLVYKQGLINEHCSSSPAHDTQLRFKDGGLIFLSVTVVW